MTDTATVTPPEERVDPANLSAWLEARSQREAATPEAQAQPAPTPSATPAPSPAQPVADWREAIVDGDDVEYGFFKGKKVPEVIKSYRHLETDYRHKTERLSQLEREVEALRQPKPETPSQPDARALLKENLLLDPEIVAASVEELAAKKAREIIDQDRAAETAKQQWQAGLTAADAAAKTAAAAYGWAEDAAQKRVVATFPYLRQLQDRGVADAFTNPAYHAHYLGELFGDPPAKGDPPAPVAPPPVPQLPDPPGVKRPASAIPPAKPISALSEEDSKAYDAVAKIAGLDPSRLKKRREK